MKPMYRHAPRIERTSHASTAALPKRKKKPQARAKPPTKANKKKSSAKGRERSAAARRVVSKGAFVVALMICIAGAAFALYSIATSSKMTVRHIDIEGAVRSDRATLLAYGGVRAGQPIFEIELDEAAQSLLRHPWVAEASIVRALPDRLLVRIREHEPSVLVSLDSIYLANHQGEVFKRWAPSDGHDLPLITGIDRSMATEEPDRVQTIIARGIELDRDLGGWRETLGRVEEINVDEALGWSVVVRPATAQRQAVRIQLGERPHERIPLASQTLLELSRRSMSPTTIWADSQKHPGRVQVSLSRIDDSEGVRSESVSNSNTSKREESHE